MEDTEQRDLEHRAIVHSKILAALKKYVFITISVGARSLKSVPPEQLKLILDGDNAKVFYRAFTHETYDYENSYEKLEILGDLGVNHFVGNAIDEQFPHLTPGEFTNMLAHYKSNSEFGNLIVKAIPEIRDLILIKRREDIKTKVLADVFEALIRAVYLTTNNTLPGIGCPCAEQVYKILSRDFKMDIKYARGHPKSLVHNIFDKKYVTEYPSEGQDFRSGGMLTVVISAEGIDGANAVINSNFRTIVTPDGTIREQRPGIDRSTASYDVYSAILDRLEAQYKVSVDDFQRQKKISVIRSYPRYSDVERAQADRKEEIYFEKKKSSLDGLLDWKLIAQNTVTKVRRLVGIDTVSKGSKGFNDAKMRLLDLYLSERV